jgi:hypothetical protein
MHRHGIRWVRIIWLSLLAALAVALALGFLAAFLLFLLPPFLTFFRDTQWMRAWRGSPSFTAIADWAETARALMGVFRRNFPTVVRGHDLANALLLTVTFICFAITRNWSLSLFDHVRYIGLRRRVDIWKSELGLPDHSPILAPLRRTLEGLDLDGSEDREELLAAYLRVSRRLAEIGRDAAYLALEISDHPVEGETVQMADQRSRDRRRVVDDVVATHGSLRSAWTDNRLLAAFPSLESAVATARESINALRPTEGDGPSVRAGVHPGHVYLDYAIPLRELHDVTAETAIAMQERAHPDSIALARESLDPLDDRREFVPTGFRVNGADVWEWTLPVEAATPRA